LEYGNLEKFSTDFAFATGLDLIFERSKI